MTASATSITTWTRIDAWPHEALEVALEARVHDPAWLLARQWQLGEHAGEDAASPVALTIEVQAVPVVSCRRGATVTRLGGLPLDCLVGAEPPAPPTAIEVAEAGAEIVHCLQAQGCRPELVERLVRRLSDRSGGRRDRRRGRAPLEPARVGFTRRPAPRAPLAQDSRGSRAGGRAGDRSA